MKKKIFAGFTGTIEGRAARSPLTCCLKPWRCAAAKTQAAIVPVKGQI